MKNNGFDPDRDGFTLVELIIASGITAAMLAVILGVTVQAIDSFERTSGRLIAEQEARLALDTLVSDLESMVFRHDGAVWFSAEIADTALNTKRAGSSDNLWIQPSFTTRQKPEGVDLDSDSYGRNGVWLRFFGIPPDRDRVAAGNAIRGDVCGIAYQILRRGVSVASEASGTPGVVNRLYGLYRTVVNADLTIQEGYDLEDWAGAYWIGGNTALLGEPVEMLRPDRDLLIASNVVEFGLRFYDASETELLYSLDSAPLGLDSVLAYRVPTESVMPSTIDVYLRVVTPKGAKILLRFEQGRTRTDLSTKVSRQTFWRQVVEENSIEVRRRVSISKQAMP